MLTGGSAKSAPLTEGKKLCIKTNAFFKKENLFGRLFAHSRKYFGGLDSLSFS